MSATTKDFYSVGGAVPRDAACYVKRDTDEELYRALLDGNFCYVLTSRQMGKSSLMVRTGARLRELGFGVAHVDLTRIGRDLTAEQWYGGILEKIGLELDIVDETDDFWEMPSKKSPLQRFMDGLERVVLTKAPGKIVIFIDEIDFVRSLPFSTDEFFAAIRELYNRRAQEPGLTRITFCLLGVASPSDLIQDPRTTPFNIGVRIQLRDLSVEEAGTLLLGLPEGTEKEQEALKRALYWTGGHPYLTQVLLRELSRSLDAEVAKDPVKEVDRLVRALFTSEEGRERDDNLLFVRNRLLKTFEGSEHEDEKLAKLLDTYALVQKGNGKADRSDPMVDLLVLSGLVVAEGSRLRVRNRIYAEVFDRRWILENMPDAAQRRQRRALWLGAARTAAIAGVVLAVVGWLALINFRLARTEREQRDAAERRTRYETYVAAMESMSDRRAANDLTGIRSTLDALDSNPAKNWEYRYWREAAFSNHSTIGLPAVTQTSVPSLAPDGKTEMIAFGSDLRFYNLQTGSLTMEVKLPESRAGFYYVSWTKEGNVLAWDMYKRALLVDAKTGFILARKTLPSDIRAVQSDESFPDSATGIAVTAQDAAGVRIGLLNLHTLEMSKLPGAKSGEMLLNEAYSRDGSEVAWLHAIVGFKRWISIRKTSDWKEFWSYPTTTQSVMHWSPDGRYLLFDKDTMLICLDVANRKPMFTIEMGTLMKDIKMSADNEHILVSTGHQALLLNLAKSKTGKTGAIALGQIVERTYPQVFRAQFLKDGRIFTFFSDFEIYGPRAAPAAIDEIRLPKNRYSPAAISPSGQLMAASFNRSHDYTANLSLPDAQRTVKELPIYSGSSDVHWRFRMYVSGSELGIVDEKTGRTLRSASPPGIAGYGVLAGSPDLRLAMTTVGTAEPQVFPIAAPTAPPYHLQLDSATAAAEFSPNGSVLAIGDWRGRVSLWRTADILGSGGRAKNPPYAQIPVCRDFASVIVFSDDGQSIAVVDDRDVHIVNVHNLQVESTLSGSFDNVNCACFTPDGARIVTGSVDGTVQIWDPRTGSSLGILGHHDSPVRAVQFIENGRTLASFSEDGVAKLWRTR